MPTTFVCCCKACVVKAFFFATMCSAFVRGSKPDEVNGDTTAVTGRDAAVATITVAMFAPPPIVFVVRPSRELARVPVSAPRVQCAWTRKVHR